MVVEDEAIIALSESFMLRKRGYTVDIANTGEAAIGLLESGAIPDLILMDIDLGPGIDGTATASAILLRWKLPIVFLTSHSSKEMVEKVRGITRYGYIIKNSGDFVMISSIEMAFDLFDKERLLEEKNSLLQMAEKSARIGYWFVYPGTSTIALSEGSSAILGIDAESCSFEDFQRRVFAGSAKARAEAFRALIDQGDPYDVSYRYRRGDTGEIVTLRSSGRAYEGMILGVFQDISEIGRLLGDLRKSEERQAVTLRSIGDGVISTDIEGRVVELNDMAERLTGWKAEEAAGRPISEVFDIVNATTREAVENPIQKVIDTGYIVGLANHTVLVTRDGTERHIADSAAPIRDDGGTMLGVVLVFRDVTHEYETQEELRHKEEIFRTLFTEAHTPMLLVDPETGRIEEANRAAEDFYGWSADRLQAMNISDINTLGPDEIASEMRKAKESKSREFRFIHRLASGETSRVLVVSGPVAIGGKKLLLSTVQDATKAYAEQARSDILLKDARHRMKNSVQMISSLINLQLAETDDDKAAAVLRELQNRVISMTLVYDQLYKSDDREVVSSAEYLASLLDAIAAGYVHPSVTLRKAIQDNVLEARFAISLGLIIGELIMNSCKHAFPSGAAGTVSIEFAKKGEDAFCLVVSDDGIGIDASRERAGEAKREGIGLALVRSLVEQENGRMEICTKTGTSITCSFPIRC